MTVTNICMTVTNICMSVNDCNQHVNIGKKTKKTKPTFPRINQVVYLCIKIYSMHSFCALPG